MTRIAARLLAGLFVGTLALGTPAAQAQPTPREVLQSSYALWGMMAAVADFCWEQSGYEVALKEAHEDWLARNLVIRDEVDAALAASGEAASLARDGEKLGANGILEIMQQAENKLEACSTWKGEVERLGAFEAETFLAYPLGLLRERDGL